MVRTRMVSSKRSTRLASSKSTSNHDIPSTFINVALFQQDPSELVAVDGFTACQGISNFRTRMADHLSWLRAERETILDTLKENGIRAPTSRNTLFKKPTNILPVEIKGEPLSPVRTEAMYTEVMENMVSTNNRSAAAAEATVPHDENINVDDEPAILPRLRNSQIKQEAISPIGPIQSITNALDRQHIKEPDSVSRFAAAVTPKNARAAISPKKEHAVTTPRNPQVAVSLKKARAPISPKKEHPAITPQKAYTRPIRITKKPQEKDKIADFETRMKAAQQRKERQDRDKAEKAKKEREEKQQKIMKNLEAQEQEAARKAEERRKRKEQEEEIRLMNKSPARSVANTPNRNKGISPSRVPMLPRTPGLARVQLFTAGSSRTPGRLPTKKTKIDEIFDDAAVGLEPFESPIRELSRKTPTIAKTKVGEKHIKQEDVPIENEGAPIKQKDVVIKKEDSPIIKKEDAPIIKKEKAPIKIEKVNRINEDFKNEQLLLLLGDEEKRKSIKLKTKQEMPQDNLESPVVTDLLNATMEVDESGDDNSFLLAENANETQNIVKMEQVVVASPPANNLESPPVNKPLLKVSMEMETESEENRSSYEMTQDKIWLPSTANNYNIEDLESGDETDDEGDPRKRVPDWANWTTLFRTTNDQYSILDRDYEAMFGSMDNPHNLPIFNQHKTKRRPRGSSAHWNSPVSNPSKGKSRFLGY